MTVIKALAVVMSVYGLTFLIVSTFVGTRVFNIALNNTVLADRFHFEASLSSLHMIWLIFSNLVLVLLTLGIFYPWAAVRTARYRCQHIAVSGAGWVDHFTSDAEATQGAIGEEVAGFFDIDIGL